MPESDHGDFRFLVAEGTEVKVNAADLRLISQGDEASVSGIELQPGKVVIHTAEIQLQDIVAIGGAAGEDGQARDAGSDNGEAGDQDAEDKEGDKPMAAGGAGAEAAQANGLPGQGAAGKPGDGNAVEGDGGKLAGTQIDDGPLGGAKLKKRKVSRPGRVFRIN